MSVITVLLADKEGQVVSVLSNSAEEELKVNVFPNPSADKILIETKNSLIEKLNYWT